MESLRSTRAISSSGASAIAPAITASATRARAYQRSLLRLTGGDFIYEEPLRRAALRRLRIGSDQKAVPVSPRPPTRALAPLAPPRSVPVCFPAVTFRITKNGTLFQ